MDERLKVLYVSVEMAPYAKVGGLADVAGSLPRELVRQDVDVRVALPAYGMTLESLGDRLEPLPPFPITVTPDRRSLVQVRRANDRGLELWLVSVGDHFGSIRRSEEIYTVGPEGYLLFSLACLETCKVLDWRPDLVHLNDWQTGFVPVYLRERPDSFFFPVASVFTIHNLAYQGEFGPEILELAGLPASLFHPNHTESFGYVNFLKAACTYADVVNTVSPRYAEEIQTPEFGCRQWGLMRHLASAHRLFGILNGIDTDVFDPRTDPHIPHNYGHDDLSGKAACKAALLKEMGLPEIEGAPLIGVVSRLSNQKGFDLILEGIHPVLDEPAQLVVLGTGDPWAAAELRRLVKNRPKRARFVERFDPALAQRIYAGADIFLMPSAFEPCGLGQLIAMRYGTLPVVRRVGGLANTVFEGVNGFVFDHHSDIEMTETLLRAIETYRDPARWRQLVKTAMTGDYGWEKSAREYIKLYRTALDFRKETLRIAALS